jgi:hypothetical protein
MNAIINNTSSGALTPSVWARTDRPFYVTGFEQMRNFIPQITGPAFYRKAFYYICHTRLNKKAFYIPFEFNAEQAYVLEFTDLKMRVIKDGGMVLETAKVITGITEANPGVLTSVAHGYSTGDEVYIENVGGMTELNGQFFLVVKITDDTFSLTDIDGNAINTSAFTTFTSGGDALRVYEITTPYPESVLWELKHAQTADLMYIVHPSYVPYKLTRAGHASWTLATYTRTSDPFTGANKYPGAVGFYGGRLHMGGTNDDPDGWFGSRAPDPTTGASRYDDFTIGTAAGDAIFFIISSQNNTSDRIRFFSGNSKFMVIGTFGGLYKANGGADGVAITPTAFSVVPISSYGVANFNPVFVNQQTVYVEVGERTLRSFEFDFLADSYQAFDKNLLADEITEGGVKQIAFTQGRPDLIWAVRNDGRLLSCTFLSKEEVAGWSEHPLGGGGKVLSVAPDARVNNFDRLIVCVERTIDGVTRRYNEYMTDDPYILDKVEYYTGKSNEDADERRYRNLTFELQKQFNRLDSSILLDTVQSVSLALSALTGTVTATAGGSVFTSADVGKYIFIKYLTGDETGVGRIVGYTSGTQVTLLISQDFHSVSIPTGGWYKLTNTVRGLHHLEGATVNVITDGAVHPDCVVTGGAITLRYYARTVIVGFKYLGMIRTLDLEFGADTGVAQGKPRTVVGLALKVRNMLGGSYGTNLRALYQIAEVPMRRDGADYTDRPTLLKQGILDLANFDGWENEKKITILQEYLPMTLLGIIPTMDVSE